ncbi:MAG: nucleotide-binding domain containing protein [Minwuia sp.]|nr:nucleotide-binding domain containing protein [Minwuia sp.]
MQQALGWEQEGLLVEQAMATIASALAVEGYRRFIVAGGGTSGAVIQALGVKALRIGPEIAPGVPWTETVGANPSLALALKSGNFGGSGFFSDAVAMFDPDTR